MTENSSLSFEPFTFPVRVYWEDTDAGGIVYYANYLKFAERARTEWLRSLNFNQTDLRKQTGIVFVVTRCAIDYLAPALLDDCLDVTVKVTRETAARLEMEQAILKNNEVLARLQVTLTALGENNKPARLSAIMRQIRLTAGS